MENAQRELLATLIEHIYSIGLLSKPTYLKAESLVHSTLDIPDFFRYPVCLTKEGSVYECAENTQ